VRLPHPGALEIRALRGKRILRRAFRDVLPPAIRRRGKRGFEPPVGEWFRTELRDLFWDVLDTGGRFLPCVRRDAVETLYRQHTTRRADRSKSSGPCSRCTGGQSTPRGHLTHRRARAARSPRTLTLTTPCLP